MGLIRQTRPAPLLLFLAGTGLAPPLFGLEIGIALRLAGSDTSLRRSVLAATNAWAVGTLTPARAGDLSLAVLLQPEVEQARSIALIIGDKVCSITVLAFLAWLSALCLRLPYTPAVIAGGGLALTAVLLVFALTVRPDAPALIRWIGERSKISLPTEAYAALRTFVRTPYLVVWVLAASLVRWVYICGVNLFMFAALSQSPSIMHVIAGTAVGRIISIIPVSIGGIGLKEPVQIPIYASAGVVSTAVVAASDLGTACSLLVAALYPLFLGVPRLDQPNKPEHP